jgi:RNA polymerase sigma-70 factor (ECF subfamily)
VDRSARFRALFQEAYGPIRRWAQHRGIAGADADDLVAEVFTIAWRRFDDIPADAAIPWLYGVAKNVARNHRRSARRRAALQLVTPVAAPVPAPDEPFDARALRAALDAVSHDDREILRLIAWDGLSPAELAVALGCSSTAARVRLHRARKRFAAAVTRAEQETRTGRERPLLEVPDVR